MSSLDSLMPYVRDYMGHTYLFTISPRSEWVQTSEVIQGFIQWCEQQGVPVELNFNNSTRIGMCITKMYGPIPRVLLSRNCRIMRVYKDLIRIRPQGVSHG